MYTARLREAGRIAHFIYRQFRSVKRTHFRVSLLVSAVVFLSVSFLSPLGRYVFVFSTNYILRNFSVVLTSTQQSTNRFQLDTILTPLCFKLRPRQIRLLQSTNYTNDSVVTVGKNFNFSRSYLSELGFPITEFSTISEQNAAQFVFVTGTSEAHFHVAMDAIARVQHFFPKYRILYYDLGSGKSEEFLRKMDHLCDVEYRIFNYSKYPPHVRDLYNFAWKPLIIHEVLLRESGLIWLDASVRLQIGDATELVRWVVRNDGIMTFDSAGHSIFTATHAPMYDYLPITRQAASRYILRGAGLVYVHRTSRVYSDVIKWWVLCALENDCIATSNERACWFNGSDVWARCSRFDQSALNILLAHHFEYDNEKAWYYGEDKIPRPQKFERIARWSRFREKLVLCDSSNRTAYANLTSNDRLTKIAFYRPNVTLMMSKDWFG